MAQIKLNLSRLSVRDKITLIRGCVTSMTGNPHFTTPQPPLTTITTAADDLEQAENDAQAARQDGKTKTTIRNGKEDNLDRLMSQLVGYVTMVSGGDEAIIQSAGMDIRAAPGTSVVPSQPQGLSATAGDHDGTMDLSWDPVVEAASYVLDSSVDPPTASSWQHLGVSTKSTFTVPGLTSGARIWFRVAAVNANGQSPWSDPATKIVP
jgi:fibronectin type III domain protein